MMTLDEFAEKLRRAAVKAKAEMSVPTEAVVEHAAKEARTVIGTYAYEWKQLAESTQEERVREGYPANEPLLRQGILRDSIDHKAHLTAEGAEGIVYSDDEVAVYQELGTKNIPPRSFLVASLVRSHDLMEATFATFAERLFL